MAPFIPAFTAVARPAFTRETFAAPLPGSPVSPHSSCLQRLPQHRLPQGCPAWTIPLHFLVTLFQRRTPPSSAPYQPVPVGSRPPTHLQDSLWFPSSPPNGAISRCSSAHRQRPGQPEQPWLPSFSVHFCLQDSFNNPIHHWPFWEV